MSDEWYFERKGKQAGPESLEALGKRLALGELSPETPVWSAATPKTELAALCAAKFAAREGATPIVVVMGKGHAVPSGFVDETKATLAPDSASDRLLLRTANGGVIFLDPHAVSLDKAHSIKSVVVKGGRLGFFNDILVSVPFNDAAAVASMAPTRANWRRNSAIRPMSRYSSVV